MAEDDDMKFSPQRATQLLENCAAAIQRIDKANTANRPVRLVLVSKLKPASDILALHQAVSPTTSASSSPSNGPTDFGAHPPEHFGENYVQELTDKAGKLPRSIKWHFIGGLQSNKCKALAEGIPNLWCVSSVDTAKKADLLEKGRAALLAAAAAAGSGEPLRVKVQINTSGEESKSGVPPGDAAGLCRHIKEHCPHLKLSGLMTIGAIARSIATTPETENEDFTTLVETRDKVSTELGIEKEDLELSMGMSADFEGAIAHGSNEVRLGSNIFGERPPKHSAA